MKFEGQKADYFAFDRNWILEVKSLETDRDVKDNERINAYADNYPSFPEFYGTIHIEELIRQYGDLQGFRNEICGYGAGNLKDIYSKADKQIYQTKKSLNNYDCVGILVLLNERVGVYDNEFIFQELDRLLEKKKNGKLEKNNIQAIWFINEYEENDKKTDLF